jgi:hypothetical protein
VRTAMPGAAVDADGLLVLGLGLGLPIGLRLYAAPDPPGPVRAPDHRRYCAVPGRGDLSVPAPGAPGARAPGRRTGWSAFPRCGDLRPSRRGGTAAWLRRPRGAPCGPIGRPMRHSRRKTTSARIFPEEGPTRCSTVAGAGTGRRCAPGAPPRRGRLTGPASRLATQAATACCERPASSAASR